MDKLLIIEITNHIFTWQNKSYSNQRLNSELAGAFIRFSNSFTTELLYSASVIFMYRALDGQNSWRVSPDKSPSIRASLTTIISPSIFASGKLYARESPFKILYTMNAKFVL